MHRVLVSHRTATLARLAAHEGRSDDAIAGYIEALADADALSVYGQATEIRLRLALAQLARGRLAEAAAAVEQVVAEARREGRPGAGALMLGATKLRALAAADWEGRLPATAAATLNAWAAMLPAPATAPVRLPGVAAGSGPSVASPAGTAPVALSPRELEVLRHIAAGDSNKLIARAFDLSPHTVKRHVANILDKLVLQSRGQAAAWYRQHAARSAE